MNKEKKDRLKKAALTYMHEHIQPLLEKSDLWNDPKGGSQIGSRLSQKLAAYLFQKILKKKLLHPILIVQEAFRQVWAEAK